MIQVQRIFKSKHLLRSNVMQYFQLILGQLLEIGPIIRYCGGVAVDGGDFFEDFLPLFKRGFFEGVEAEIDCSDDFFVREFAAHVGVGGALDDYM